MDAHLRLLVHRFDESIHALEARAEYLRVTRPPFFQPKTRQLAITEEHKLEATALSAHADEDRVAATAKQVERIIVAKLSKLILAFDPESAEIAGQIIEDTRKYARLHWLDEDQNDQAYPFIVEEVEKMNAPPPEAPVIAGVYGQDEHPKDVPQGDPWANAGD